MSLYNNLRNTNQSDTTSPPKGFKGQYNSASRGRTRELSDRINIPFENRLELPQHQNLSPTNLAVKSPTAGMDQSQRGGRYYPQGEGGRGSLDDRIGFSEYGRAGGKQYGSRNRSEHMSYDDKPAPRNLEDRVHTDSRTLEDRISVATPASAKKFTTNSQISEGNVSNRPGNNVNTTKQMKKPQNKAQKQANRAQESLMLTEQQQEDTVNGGNIMVKGIANAGKIQTAAGTASHDTGIKQSTIQPNHPTGRLGLDTSLPLSQKDVHTEGKSPSSAQESSTPSPMATTLQEQLREKVLASMKKKAEAQVAVKEKDVVVSSFMPPISTKETEFSGVEVEKSEGQPISENQSSLLALEQSLNLPLTKSKADLERDAAVDAMLAEVQAFSEDKKASNQQAAQSDRNENLQMETDRMGFLGSIQGPVSHAHDATVISSSTRRPMSSISEKKANSPRDTREGDRTPQPGNTDISQDRDYRESDKVPKLDTKQKNPKPPPIYTTANTPALQSSAKDAHRSYNFLEFEEEEDDIQKEAEKPLSASSREQTQGAYKRVRIPDEDGSNSAERRPRYWEDRSDIIGRESHMEPEHARRHSDKPQTRSHTKESYPDDVYIDGVLRENESRESYYLPQRLPPHPPSARSLPPDEYNYAPQEYAPYSGLRYLPVRGDEHLGRQTEYDSYYKDVAEWLDITGFHDIDYRQTALRRYRERDLDRLYALRVAAATVSREELTSPLDVRVRGMNSGMMAPPAQAPQRGVLPEVAVRVPPRPVGYSARQSQQGLSGDRPSHRFTDGYIVASPGPESISLKRRISQDDEYESRPPEKTTRLSYDASLRILPLHPDGEQLEYRNARPEVIENAGSIRRISEVQEPETGNAPPPRRRPATPVREKQEKIAPRSPSPNRFHENEHRKSTQKDANAIKGRQHVETEDQVNVNTYRSVKKPHEKNSRRFGSPESSPKTEKGFHKGGNGYDYKGGGRFNNQGKYSNQPDDRKFSHGHDYHNENRSSQGNFSHRRGSFDEGNRKKYGHMRGSEYGREWYNKGDRRDRPVSNRPNMSSDQMEIEATTGGSNTDTKYFIVKSFNHDNVIHAQRDGIWATQEKNAEIFNDAFQTARDVILIFSVNKSGKFQGYARMESAPGTADTPVWAKGLLWKSSGAFHIRWITICDIGFYHLVPLLNRLNEDQPVFIGRDGQEIDPETGAALCSIVDERASSMH